MDKSQVILGKDNFDPYTDVQPIIAVDWDGTIALDGCKIDWDLLDWLKKCQDYGAYVILYTCRRADDVGLQYNLKALKEQGYSFDAVNQHHPKLIEAYGESPNSKIFAHWYIDDQAVRWSLAKMDYAVWRVNILKKVMNYVTGHKQWYYM